jgi:hypothetical protein
VEPVASGRGRLRAWNGGTATVAAPFGEGAAELAR